MLCGRREVDSGTGESGDLEALAEREGTVRLPERRVSLGERGGPMVAAWAMMKGRWNKHGKGV